MPKTCPSCHSPHIRSLGVGTQKLVEDVRSLLPDARVLRWDRDTAPTVAAHTELLRSFRDREADILVGTQMIAKGLDIPSVTLVGVVLADLGLNLPDFRAPERTFQLLTQVAGRAGRGSERGEVIIQSYEPDHYAVQAAMRQDYRGFYEREIELRRAHGNPPVTKLVRLLFGHSQPNLALNEAQRVASGLRRAAREWDVADVDVVGPAPGYPPRVRGAWRWHLFVRGGDPRLLLDKVDLPPGWTVDVDPVNVV
jgi:primosomal protein N' (replication factor Y)